MLGLLESRSVNTLGHSNYKVITDQHDQIRKNHRPLLDKNTDLYKRHFYFITRQRKQSLGRCWRWYFNRFQYCMVLGGIPHPTL